MLSNERGKLADGFKARIFRKPRAFKAFIIMDRPFFGIRDGAVRQHRAHAAGYFVRAGCIDPAPMQMARIISGQTRHIDTRAILLTRSGRCSKGRWCLQVCHGVSPPSSPPPAFLSRQAGGGGVSVRQGA